jgi:POT family proton-dependent oligopeptide transporter
LESANDAQPRGLRVIVMTEAFDRFSYYGMITLLPLYLNAALLKPGVIENVIGLSAFRSLLFGDAMPSVVALGSAIYGFYAGTVSIMPLLGGILGDRLLGARRAVLLGCLMMAAGHGLMVSTEWFFVAIALLMFGSGLVRANMAAQVASLYGPGDTRRKRGFGIYLIGLNVGALAAPLIAGTLGERIGFDWGFGAAAIAMVVAIVIYLAGWRQLPEDALRNSAAFRRPTLTLGDWRTIAALLLLMTPLIFGVMAYNQAFNILLVWANTGVDRDIAGFVMPVTWFVTIDGTLTVVAIIVVTRIWARQASRGRPGNDWNAILLGGLLYTAALLSLAFGTWRAGGGLVPMWPVIMFFILADLATPLTYTVIQSIFARAAPVTVVALMLAVFAMYDAVANYGVGALGGLYGRVSTTNFWLVHAAIAAVGVITTLVLRPLIGPLLRDVSTPPRTPQC